MVQTIDVLVLGGDNRLVILKLKLIILMKNGHIIRASIFLSIIKWGILLFKYEILLPIFNGRCLQKLSIISEIM